MKSRFTRKALEEGSWIEADHKYVAFVIDDREYSTVLGLGRTEAEALEKALETVRLAAMEHTEDDIAIEEIAEEEHEAPRAWTVWDDVALQDEEEFRG